jgi:phosphoribosyl 1,2-cyclic phosphate phosphodiesterase
VLGYRIGNVSYLTDLSEIPKDSYRLLANTSVLILGVLRYAPHPTHLNFENALRIVDQVQPDQAYFTHLSHDFDHDKTNSELPSHVALAYDGLSWEMDEP